MNASDNFNLIAEAHVGVRLTGDQRRRFFSLPGVLAALARDDVAEFPALRPHQRHSWHAFTVQLAAMALHGSGVATPPREEAAWTALLRGLTPDSPNDAPWCLVSPPDQPAFMQPPVPGGTLAEFKSVVATPDALDMLVTSKNHDIKSDVMIDARPEDWLFALISLQTMEGFMGAGNYGISRMNGGFASRPALGIQPPGQPGARFVRDVHVLLSNRRRVLENDLKAAGGIGLVWLEPWDGTSQIRFSDLDPFYIEICRRVRLVERGGVLSARTAGSKKARIAAAALKGRTGDPWAPIELTDRAEKALAEPKALTITGSGFSYEKMTELLFSKRYKPPLAQDINDRDAETGLTVVAAGLARGQGKTEGYHERLVPITKRVRTFMKERATDQLAAWARERVNDVGVLRGKVLRPALFALLQDGPDAVDYRDNDSAKRAEPVLRRFEHHVDATFFADLWLEVEEAEGGQAARETIRFQWQRRLAEHARGLLSEAAGAVPHATMRRYRAQVRADDLFQGAFYKHFPHLRSKESQRDAH
jgi:CRISPR system Cascade subunit CasA